MTPNGRQLRERRTRHSAAAALPALLATLWAAFLLLAVSAAPARAWKPKTHIYLAEQALKDAVDNGKVTIYETDYRTGRILGVLGEFPVEPRILEALKKYPKQYRAGVLGPDAYPDIATGQKIIHPHASHPLDGQQAGGTNSWLTHLWNLSFKTPANPSPLDGIKIPIFNITKPDDPKVRAFVIGYITHAVGDMYAHTFMNHFTGGEFMLQPDPRNALKHIILEGYIGKRTPLTIDTFGSVANNPPEALAAAYPGSSLTSLVAEEARRRNIITKPLELMKLSREYEDAIVTQNDISIEGLEGYLWREMTWARPDSILKKKLLEVQDRKYSIPYLFSELRNSLQKDVDSYYRIRDSKSGPARVAWQVAQGPECTFKEHWIEDIDKGLQQWPKTSHEIAKALIYNETNGGADLKRVNEVIDDYVKNYLVYMGPVPDGVVDTFKIMAKILDAVVPDFISEAIKALMKDMANTVAKAATGRTIQEWADFISNPETHFDPIMNGPGGEHPGRTAQRVTLAQFNREYLNIQDSGFTQGNKETFRINEFPPAFNTVQMCKLMLLGKDGMSQLIEALAAKGCLRPTLPANFENVMLGFLQSIDNDNQWQGLSHKDSLPGARLLFAQNGGSTYQKLFLRQVGEEEWVTARPSTGTPPPGTPTGPTTPTTPTPEEAQVLLDKLKGKWKTSLGTVLNITEVVRTLPPPMLEGKANKEYENGGKIQAEGFYLSVEAGGVITGLWNTTPTGRELSNTGRVTIALNPDGDSFTGKVILQTGDEIVYNGTRIKEGGNNTGNTGGGDTTNSGNSGTPNNGGVVPPPADTATGIARIGDGKFYALDKLDIRLDEMKPGRDGASMELFVTYRNRTQKPYGITAGGFKLTITDSDGVSIRDMGNVYRVSGERPERIPNTVIVNPGGEARIRWVFPVPKGFAPPLKSLRISEYVAPPVIADLTGIKLPGEEEVTTGDADSGSAPAPAPAAEPAGRAAIGNGQFFGVDDVDVRFDGVRRGRDGTTMELFVTVKNPGSTNVGLITTTLRLTATDADGLSVRPNGELYRVTGDVPERITHTVTITPGDEAKVRYVFPMSRADLRFTKLSISGYRTPVRTVDLPDLGGAQ